MCSSGRELGNLEESEGGLWKLDLRSPYQIRPATPTKALEVDTWFLRWTSSSCWSFQSVDAVPRRYEIHGANSAPFPGTTLHGEVQAPDGTCD